MRVRSLPGRISPLISPGQRRNCNVIQTKPPAAPGAEYVIQTKPPEASGAEYVIQTKPPEAPGAECVIQTKHRPDLPPEKGDPAGFIITLYCNLILSFLFHAEQKDVAVSDTYILHIVCDTRNDPKPHIFTRIITRYKELGNIVPGVKTHTGVTKA